MAVAVVAVALVMVIGNGNSNNNYIALVAGTALEAWDFCSDIDGNHGLVA